MAYGFPPSNSWRQNPDTGCLVSTHLSCMSAYLQFEDNNTNLTALTLTGDITDSAARRFVKLYADSVTASRILRRLHIPYKNLTAVPSDMWRLKNLEELHLNYNAIPRVPAEVSSLEVLRVLDLEGNRLEAVPAELGMLTYLMELDLCQNLLTTLPATFSKLTSLIHLNLVAASF